MIMQKNRLSELIFLGSVEVTEDYSSGCHVTSEIDVLLYVSIGLAFIYFLIFIITNMSVFFFVPTRRRCLWTVQNKNNDDWSSVRDRSSFGIKPFNSTGGMASFDRWSKLDYSFLSSFVYH